MYRERPRIPTHPPSGAPGENPALFATRRSPQRYLPLPLCHSVSPVLSAPFSHSVNCTGASAVYIAFLPTLVGVLCGSEKEQKPWGFEGAANSAGVASESCCKSEQESAVCGSGCFQVGVGPRAARSRLGSRSGGGNKSPGWSATATRA